MKARSARPSRTTWPRTEGFEKRRINALASANQVLNHLHVILIMNILFAQAAKKYGPSTIRKHGVIVDIAGGQHKFLGF